MALADNPDALAYYLESQGITVIYDQPKFTVEFPVADRRRIAAELDRQGLVCKNPVERQGRDRNGHTCSIFRGELQRAPEKTSYDELSLLTRVCVPPSDRDPGF